MTEKTELSFSDDVLFHGSPYKLDKIIPNQAIDSQFKEGCQFAVYATSNINMAICFALGCIEEDDKAERIMMPEYGDKMHFINCHPNYGGKGYVYMLEKDKFVYAYGSQWVCFEPIIPKKVIEISVDDYRDTHCIISHVPCL